MSYHNLAHEGTPLESKAEGDSGEIENEDGSKADAIVSAVLDVVRGDLVARLEKLEIKAEDTARRLSRPAIITAPAEAPGAFERKAFTNYVRRGIERMPSDEVKALNVATGSAGGFIAPQEFGTEMLKRLIEFSPIRQYARTVSISAPQITYPRLVNRVGASWVSETGARTGSEPSFEQVSLAPFELATYVDVSTALLEDNSYDLDGELAVEFAEMFGKTEGAAFVAGTGVGQPKGLLTASGIAEVKTGVAGGFPASNPADTLLDLYHALPTVVAQNGAWLMNRKTMSVVRKWKDGEGRYLVVDPISASAASTLLGRPIVEATDMPDVAANATPIMFGDLSGYRIVDRVDLQTLRDPYTLAGVGQVRIHARKRVGADVTHPDRFVKLKVAA